MTKREIQNAIRQSNGGADFATVSDISRFLGKSREFVRNQITADLEFIGAEGYQCRSKRYYIGDVAERIMQIRRS